MVFRRLRKTLSKKRRLAVKKIILSDMCRQVEVPLVPSGLADEPLRVKYWDQIFCNVCNGDLLRDVIVTITTK